MRITKRSNIAMRLLMFCALNSERLVTKSEVAVRCGISESHLAQVVNRLSQMGVLYTQRGRNGGISLDRPAARIALGPVFRAFEQTVPDSGCFADCDNTCPLTPACRLTRVINDASEAFFSHLDGFTLEDLVKDNKALKVMM